MDLDLEKLKQESEEAQNKKGLLGVLGNVAQGFSDVPSAYQLLKGGKSTGPNIKGVLDSVAGSIGDPVEKQMKTYAMYKAAKEQKDMERKTAEESALDDAESTLTKAWRAAGINQGYLKPDEASGMTARQIQEARKANADKLDMDKIKAKSQIDFGNAVRLKQLDQKGDMERILAEQRNKNSDGFKALDKDFAKDHNDWTSGGAESARMEIQKLKDVANSLEKGNLTTGGLTGKFPDMMTSDAVLKARADVNSTVMNSLRAILGAAFTEKEGERVIKNTWNEADSTKNNLARIQRLAEDLESKAQAKDAKTGFFQESGTLAGFKHTPKEMISEKDKKALAWALKNPNDPRAAQIMQRNNQSIGKK